MTEPIINILRLIFIGTATTIVRIIGQLAIPTGEQTVLSPSIFAQNCFYDLRDFCLLPDRRAVPAHTEKNGREPYLAGAAIRLCLLRSVDRLPLGASAPCGSLGSHHLSCGGRPGSHRHGAAAGLAVRANKAACKKAQSEAARPSRTYHNPLLYSRAAASVLRYRYLFVLPRKNRRDPVMVPAGRFCDCLRYGVAEPLCGR